MTTGVHHHIKLCFQKNGVLKLYALDELGSMALKYWMALFDSHGKKVISVDTTVKEEEAYEE